MKPTGAVERRGKYHRLHAEYICECGHKQWFRTDQPKRVPLECRHKGEAREAEGKYLVVITGRNVPQWACGEATDDNPWQKCWRAHFVNDNATQEMVWDPPAEALRFDTRQQAQQWKLDRIRFLGSKGRAVGKYGVVQR